MNLVPRTDAAKATRRRTAVSVRVLTALAQAEARTPIDFSCGYE